MAKKNEKVEEVTETTSDTRQELVALLKEHLPQCFEKEPAPAYTPYLDKVVDQIINLID